MSGTAFVTAIGSLSAEAVICGLKKNGYKVIGGDINPRDWIANSLIVDKFYQMPLVTEIKTYLAFLAQVCEENGVGYILPLTDIEADVLNDNRERFEQNLINICLSSRKTVRICRNKFILYETLSMYSIPKLIPTVWAVAMEQRALVFPFICKPYNGRSSQGIYRIQDKLDWEYFKNREKILDYITQPEIVGNIVTVDVIRNSDTRECIAIPRRELIRTVNGAGISVYVFENDQLESRCRCIAEALDINGCVNFEFIEREEDYYFMECNPRFSGGVAFSCFAGYDCVLNHMRCFQGEHIDQNKGIKNQYIARKYLEYIMEEIENGVDRVEKSNRKTKK